MAIYATSPVLARTASPAPDTSLAKTTPNLKRSHNELEASIGQDSEFKKSKQDIPPTPTNDAHFDGTGTNTGAENTESNNADAENTHTDSMEKYNAHSDNTTDIDIGAWKGFCQIESDPAYFSVILREMGVEYVTVREAFSLDPEMLGMLPQPIHGLILLFHYREFATSDQEEECPSNIWFANQIPMQNSCATLAMMNIIMNSPDIEIGEHLEQFKNFSKDLTPFQRGEAFDNFEFVKKTHNSFAKRMDVLESDKHLAYKAQKGPSRRMSTDSDSSTDSYVEQAHHFVAFVPVGNEVWKLDGMDAQPTKLGTFDIMKGETWMATAAATINEVMSAGDDDYSIISISQSPQVSLRKQLAVIVSTVKHVDLRLSSIGVTIKDGGLTEMGMYGVDLSCPIEESIKAMINSEKTNELLNRRELLLQSSNEIVLKILEEVEREDAEKRKADQRRFDSGPVIKRWLEMLACNGYLEKHLQNHMLAKGEKGGNSQESAAAAAKEYSLHDVSAYDNPSAIASNPNVDTMTVSVSVPEHYILVQPAFEAGKEIFVEWPPALNLAEAEELVELAKAKKVRTMVDLQARQNMSTLKAKEIVESGKLGGTLNTAMYGHGIITGSTVFEGYLYGLPTESSANLPTIPFQHAVDAPCYVLGEMKNISATLANLYPEVDLLGAGGKPVCKVAKTSHDHISITGVSVNGGGLVNCIIAGGLFRSRRDFHWDINGMEGSLLLEGSKVGGHVQMYQPKVKQSMHKPEAALYIAQ